MQNRYVGDIGDFAKYSLLNALSEGKKLGIAWYLYPDEEHNDDGRHTSYLDQPEIWRNRSPEVFDKLSTIVTSKQRNVKSILLQQVISSEAVADEILQVGLNCLTSAPMGPNSVI